MDRDSARVTAHKFITAAHEIADLRAEVVWLATTAYTSASIANAPACSRTASWIHWRR